MRNAGQLGPASIAQMDDLDSLLTTATDSPPAKHSTPPRSISAIEIFRLRCEARAYLYACRQLTLTAAVDALQEMAVRDGLIVTFGQDAIQAILAKEFEAVNV